jgi:hypothetical protein
MQINDINKAYQLISILTSIKAELEKIIPANKRNEFIQCQLYQNEIYLTLNDKEFPYLNFYGKLINFNPNQEEPLLNHVRNCLVPQSYEHPCNFNIPALSSYIAYIKGFLKNQQLEELYIPEASVENIKQILHKITPNEIIKLKHHLNAIQRNFHHYVDEIKGKNLFKSDLKEIRLKLEKEIEKLEKLGLVGIALSAEFSEILKKADDITDKKQKALFIKESSNEFFTTIGKCLKEKSKTLRSELINNKYPTDCKDFDFASFFLVLSKICFSALLCIDFESRPKIYILLSISACFFSVMSTCIFCSSLYCLAHNKIIDSKLAEIEDFIEINKDYTVRI